MSKHEHHGMHAERRHQRQTRDMQATRREVVELVASGMSAHEIIAAFRARRRIMGHGNDCELRPMIGQISIVDGDGECLMLEIYDDIDDD